MSLPKLVRDKIPSIIKSAKNECVYYIAKSKEYEECLYTKLEEELAELSESPSVEEAADMYEVFLSILNHHGISLPSVKHYSDVKKEERGGFLKRIILEKVLK